MLERLDTAGKYLWQRVAARHLEEAVPREGIDRDIDALRPAATKASTIGSRR